MVPLSFQLSDRGVIVLGVMEKIVVLLVFCVLYVNFPCVFRPQECTLSLRTEILLFLFEVMRMRFCEKEYITILSF